MCAGRVYRRVDRGVQYPWVSVSVSVVDDDGVDADAVGVEEEEGWKRV
jgi:hypothetical protein